MAFNLADYEPVEKRITDFWVKYPNGRIHTVIVSLDEKQVIVRAEVFTEREDHRPVTVDHAQEKVGGTGMTANSWLEIACTSAIGRALADLDFAKKGKRPSREEMTKAVQHETPPAPKFPEDHFVIAANEAFSAKDLNKLRELYTQAASDNQPETVLHSITQLALKLDK